MFPSLAFSFLSGAVDAKKDQSVLDADGNVVQLSNEEGSEDDLVFNTVTAGMSDEETERTGELFLSLAGKHSLVVVEHDMTFVKQIAANGRVTVLHQGALLCEGKFDDVQADPRVREVYLGRGKHGTR